MGRIVLVLVVMAVLGSAGCAPHMVRSHGRTAPPQQPAHSRTARPMREPAITLGMMGTPMQPVAGSAANLVPLPPADLFTQKTGSIGVTKDQQTKIAQFYKTSAEKAQAINVVVWKSSQGLRLELLATKLDQKKVASLTEAYTKAEAADIRNQVQAWKNLRTLLTARQIAKMRASMGPGGVPERPGSMRAVEMMGNPMPGSATNLVNLPSLDVFTSAPNLFAVTNDQRPKIVQLYRKNSEVALPINARVSKASQALRLVLLSSKLNQSRIASLTAAYSKAEAADIQNQVRTWKGLRAILTKDQFAMLMQPMGRVPGPVGHP